MTKLEAALLDVTAFLDDRRIPYMIIDGFANLFWGVERFTRDLDLTVEVPEGDLPDLVTRLQQRFDLTVRDPLEFARRNHLIRVRTRTGVDADLILATLPYEFGALRRAVAVAVSGGTVRVCSPEDLVIHKLAAERLQDRADVEGIVMRQSQKLDREYLGARVRELAAGLERPEIADFLTRTLQRADAGAPGDDPHG